MISRLQAVGRQPRWSLLAALLEAQPRAAEFVDRDFMAAARLVCSKVDDILAVDVIFADRERHQPVAETLRALTDGRHDIEGQIKGRLAFAIEATARQSGAVPGQWRKRPRWVMRAVAPADKPQA